LLDVGLETWGLQGGVEGKMMVRGNKVVWSL